MAINVGEERVGRGLSYDRGKTYRTSEGTFYEHGRVVRWNSDYVFVQFDDDAPDHAKACSREDLHWDEEITT